MEKCIYLYVYMSKQSISTLRTLKPKTGYGAIGEDLVAGADAAEKRKVFSLVGLGPKFFQGENGGKTFGRGSFNYLWLVGSNTTNLR